MVHLCCNCQKRANQTYVLQISQPANCRQGKAFFSLTTFKLFGGTALDKSAIFPLTSSAVSVCTVDRFLQRPLLTSEQRRTWKKKMFPQIRQTLLKTANNSECAVNLRLFNVEKNSFCGLRKISCRSQFCCPNCAECRQPKESDFGKFPSPTTFV